jgi:hypothetical protein
MAKEIEQNISRLVHLGLALPFIHHFMSRLRDLHLTVTQRRSVKVNGEYAKDLRMMLGFLKIANKGISLNSIAFRGPTHIYRSDSCPAGLGGYSHEGWAWRWYLPDNLLFRALNNLLEHLAAIVLPWVDIIAGRLKCEDCVLSMNDSTTPKNGSKKKISKLGEKNPIQALVRIKAPRMQATLFLKRGLKSYSQWFKGERKKVSDALSCDNDKTDNKLTLTIKTCCPSQVSSHFEICPLPNKIISWLTLLLQQLPVSKRLREVHTRSKLGHGSGGKSTPSPLESETTTTSSFSLKRTNTSSLEHLPWLSGMQSFQNHLMNDWLRAQSEIPSSMFAQPSEKMGIQTQHLTKMANLPSFYSKNSGRSKTQIPKKSTKKPSLCQSSLKSTSATAPNSKGQQASLQPLQSSLQCVPVNTSRFRRPSSEEPKSSDEGTSTFSRAMSN